MVNNWLLRIGLAFIIVTLLLASQGKAVICGRAVLAITAELNSTAPHDPCVLLQIMAQMTKSSTRLVVPVPSCWVPSSTCWIGMKAGT
ncbi:MAG: hypothetical protein R6X32_21380 [Chloroflexota bacterium]